ncbi:ABC transporter ATP-binding protein [Halomonas sp. QX-2]|uniref:ABC transporter ATP-binding protein n=1 Tax=Vreelandella sedimenti TaxID=2729618 RepID=A0A7Z0N8F7_9GAMM|nr:MULTISPECIES: ABC transporter ATP-binding protein [Halomonas]MCL5425852.1 ABC transporter ATP-binding protein [Gammaproteobacteria bacterium]MCP1305333.1 ABC transporter ATP-binding protein [Halomonas sp. R1t8]MCP1329560.1 ABC transporter ATP-binding protein [Halomonas sp. R1t4]HBQ06937.1 ABC transporter ATP-binding protein [Halomonas sp.]MDC8443646.1 ABC transporter ATP-binding protein [Halomonas aquamarina]
MTILRTEKLYKHFDGVKVAQDVNFSMEHGEIRCLIGPNGAGKSTFFKLVLGEHQPSSGEIYFSDQKITKLRSFERVKQGIAVKFQVPGIFSELSVWQNMQIAVQNHLHGDSMTSAIDKALAFVRLTDKAGELAGELSHGEQQWLEIGMAVSTEPRLLLLDEPTAGMTPEETARTGEMIQELNRKGMSILAVEHDMEFVRQIAHKVTVLNFGEIFAEGTINEIEANEEVARIYLGTADDDE